MVHKEIIIKIKGYGLIYYNFLLSWQHRYWEKSNQFKFYREQYTDTQINNDFKEGYVFMSDGKMPHGGLTDRLKGILETYYIAKKRKIPFYINWVHPFQLTDFLIPNKIDWRINENELIYTKKNSFPVCMSATSSPVKNKYNYHLLKLMLRKTKEIRQFHIYTNLGINPKNYNNLYHELFKPSHYLNQQLLPHLNILTYGGKSKFSSFSFRFTTLLGDFADDVNQPLNDEDAKNLMYKCKQALINQIMKLPESEMIFVTSDSIKFLSFIKDCDKRIYINIGPISHIDYFNQKEDNKSTWLKMFIDQNIIMNAHKVFLMKTGKMYNSYFPKFAALIGGKEFQLIEF